MEEEESKTWWKSRTALTALAVAGVGFVCTAINIITGHTVLGLEEQTTIAATIGGAVFFALRLITRKPVA